MVRGRRGEGPWFGDDFRGMVELAPWSRSDSDLGQTVFVGFELCAHRGANRRVPRSALVRPYGIGHIVPDLVRTVPCSGHPEYARVPSSQILFERLAWSQWGAQGVDARNIPCVPHIVPA